MEQDLVTVRTYAEIYGVTPECVRKWIKQGKANLKVIDGVNFIILNEDEARIRDNIFSKHPTKGLHKISEVMDAMYKGKIK